LRSAELLDGFELRDGIYTRVDDSFERSEYRREWESHAAADHVTAAIARTAPAETLEALTAKLTPVWEDVPSGSRFDTILDVGCGYGRLALTLSRLRSVTCSAYVGIDVSRTMLSHLIRYWDRFDVFPGARRVLVCASADAVPLEDASVDLAVSSAVFLHMGRRYVEQALAEVARVLRPGGRFLFETSFPNRYCPANLPSLLLNRGSGRHATDVTLYSRREVERLVVGSGLAAAAGGYELEASERALLPKAVRGRGVPLARRANELVNRSRSAGTILPVSFTVRSPSLRPA